MGKSYVIGTILGGYTYLDMSVPVPSELIVQGTNVVRAEWDGTAYGVMDTEISFSPRYEMWTYRPMARVSEMEGDGYYEINADVPFVVPMPTPAPTPDPTLNTAGGSQQLKQLTLKTLRLTGAPKVEKYLTVKYTVKPKKGVKVKRTWLVNGQTVGKTGKRLKVKAAWRGSQVTCQVTATKAGYETTQLTSPAKTVKKK